MSTKRSLKNLRSRLSRGASAVEYILIVILVSLSVIGAMKAFGNKLNAKFTAATQELDNNADSKANAAVKSQTGAGSDTNVTEEQ